MKSSLNNTTNPNQENNNTKREKNLETKDKNKLVVSFITEENIDRCWIFF